MTFKTTLYTGAAMVALGTGMAQAQDFVFPKGEGAFSWDSLEEFASNHDYSGQSIDITGPWTGADAELMESVVAYFEEATGASVNYSGSDSFEQDIVISTEANSAPNIAVFPQPGLLADLAQRGAITPLEPETAEWIRENYSAGESWVDLASFEGEGGEEHLYAFPYKIDVKSLVWYVPEQFEEAGYEVPETYEGLKELTQQMADDGVTPWCIGLGSGAATGWPATDWVEDLMLRTATPEQYDAWVANDLAFDSPEVVNAIEEYGFFLQDGFVNGGREAAATTDFRDSPSGLFQFPPECYMHKQATFIPTFFPEGSEVGTDVDFFYFPAPEGGDAEQPVLGAGTMFAITNDSEPARGFIEYLQTPLAHEIWAAQGGLLTPHTGINPEVFGTDDQRALNDILLDATTFRFDASDLMPGEIGAGAFWTQMVEFTTGSQDAQATGEAIQSRWDQLSN
ncbi:maltose-binding protein /trehalose-binding protein /sucrose-binding protein [Palleronia marisminoris]|uniref:Bacterial extracellular solute-binding protein n=1 Tax=Palleronia marisminoris TaxID=315423 RepID=A0A1Y5TF93_9RHOB|nr:ABC transporter substrate-binding protein [Palleronia marisminoris]SFH37577.1 maltose-binding protein /trehalose-binding protein /sucrose-binding protein [Palleronia marisminoris]SLN62682.1 Bacterial extracellular solute-binding protein [Palleronia marisminoris]